VNERGLIEVPENAVRDEPIAFGLTGIQLGICGIAVLVGAALNLLPIWEPARFVLIALLAGPIAISAALPIQGEPAYRWLLRAMRFLRSRRVWQAELVRPDDHAERDESADKRPVSDAVYAAGVAEQEPQSGSAWHVGDNTGTQPQRASSPGGKASADEASVPAAGEQVVMGAGQLLRPHVVRPEDDGSDEPVEGPPLGRPEPRTPVPHLLPGLRIAAFISFAGGVGKTSLAVESATLIAAHARYLTIDGDELPLSVLLLDASRVTAGAAAIRLGLDGEAISKAANPARWHHSRSVEDLAVTTPTGVDIALVPAHPITLAHDPQPEPERDLFRTDHVDDFLEGAREAGYQLLVVDLGSHLEDGHRHLIDRADLILGVVRPTLESLPDVHRLANVLRELGAGRKLSLVANLADDDHPVRQHAHEYGVAVAASVPPSPTFVNAAERGEPAWSLDPALRPALRAVAATVWPLLADGTEAPKGGLLASARRLARIGPGTGR
jgi:CO dehydrogenase nickel-insertion accessory protein CooC1